MLFRALVGLALACAGCAAQEPGAPGSRIGSGEAPGAGAADMAPSASEDSPSSALPSNPSSGGLILPTSTGGTNTVKPKIGPNGEETCASGMQTTTPVTPTVWLVIDGSSSMNQPFEGGDSRWLSLRSTLMDPGGVVDALQAVVRFGMVIYSGGGDPCVQAVTVEPELNNLDNLAGQYPMQPLGRGTPTDKALEIVVNHLADANTSTLDTFVGPTYLVLATDGAPNDSCGGGGFGGFGVDVEQRVIDITATGAADALQMYVISMAGDDAQLQAHLNGVANATISQTPPFVPATRDDLIGAFLSIVGGASCLVSLDGSVEVGRECKGSVELNSEELACNDPNGWMLFDASTVQLTGAACDTFQDQQSILVASFPCEIFSPN